MEASGTETANTQETPASPHSTETRERSELRHPTTGNPAVSPMFSPKRTGVLLGAAFLVPLAFDRLVVAIMTSSSISVYATIVRIAAFWAVFLLASVVLFFRTGRQQPLWWFTGLACIALISCVIMLAHNPQDANAMYQVTTLFLALPALTMLHLELGTGYFDPLSPGRTAVNWLRNWFIAPFIHIGRLPQALSCLTTAQDMDETADNNVLGTTERHRSGTRGALMRIGIALLIAIPIVAMLIMLLAQADMVFSYGLHRLLDGFNIGSLVGHICVVLILFVLLFSGLCDIEMRRNTDQPADQSLFGDRKPFDRMIVVTILALVLAVYAIFCTMQFTFLFAQAGLPAGYTYAEYAREGFFQLITLTCLNLAGFGVILTLTKRTKVLNAMLCLLLASTGVLTASAAVRLGLYIGTYGLTPLRFISMAFIVLLALITAICPVRLWVPRMPLLTICFVAFVVWYIVMGFMNPADVINAYNIAHLCGAGACLN